MAYGATGHSGASRLDESERQEDAECRTVPERIWQDDQTSVGQRAAQQEHPRFCE